MILPLLGWLVAGCSAQTPDTSTRFPGECDASTVLAVDDVLLVADDESTAISAYRRDGTRVDRISLAAGLEQALGRSLNRKDGDPRELDLEGSARDGDRIWWTGSHGLNRKGKDRPNRRLLFATTLPREEGGRLALDVLGTPRDVQPLLLALPDLGAVLRDNAERAPKEGGLDIEGLALDRRTGQLLLGLRGPLDPQGRAWVVALEREGLDDPTATPVVTVRARLDLGGRGIRSITWSERRDSFVVVAGPTDSDGEFDLYTWDGQGAPHPLDHDLGDLRPEGLTEDGDALLLVSDDGGVDRDGTDCKERREDGADDPRVYFRVQRLEP